MKKIRLPRPKIVINETEPNVALDEIVRSYLKNNNNTGTTKDFDFKYILEKYESQSKDIFNHLNGI